MKRSTCKLVSMINNDDLNIQKYDNMYLVLLASHQNDLLLQQRKKDLLSDPDKSDNTHQSQVAN